MAAIIGKYAIFVVFSAAIGAAKKSSIAINYDQKSFTHTYINCSLSLAAAVGHDLDHPGLNEKYLIATSSHLAGLYNNSSVLENHHWRTCVALMHESGLAKSLSVTERKECEDLIQKMVLATDISR